ncbi:MAG: ATP-binding protein, partial [Pirellula sp.]
VDAVRLRQVVINLVGNAIKFTERGSVAVEASMIDGVRPMLQINIVDTGIGISSQAIDKIFDPFSQEDSSITRRFGGTGLGLSICRYLAELMGGGVSATSVQGQGSVFSIIIDPGSLQGIKPMSPEQLASATKRAFEDEKSAIQLPRCNILVVDDGQANRQLVTVYLERAGATVTCATNGKEACDLTVDNTFDAIIMDVHMPVMDGMTATKTMRKQGLTIPIIALTGNVMKDDEDSCRAAGYSGFLAKPIRMNTLLATVSELLGNVDPSETISLQPVPIQPSETESIAALHRSVTDLTQSLNNADQQHATDSTTDWIESDLPIEDDEICSIVQEFVVHLRERISLMEQVHRQGNSRELEDLAHWLKGAGGSLGFHQFTIPARDLEIASKKGELEKIPMLVQQIRSIVDRVRAPNELEACTS